jgi:imidazoleglycerol phosphate dehydratase HisB
VIYFDHFLSLLVVHPKYSLTGLSGGTVVGTHQAFPDLGMTLGLVISLLSKYDELCDICHQ